jgi:hypothetical protein
MMNFQEYGICLVLDSLILSLSAPGLTAGPTFENDLGDASEGY